MRTVWAMALALSAGLCLAVVAGPWLPITVINESD